MICEICGESANKGFKVKLEGGTVSACGKCAKLGEVVEAIQEKKPPKPKKSKSGEVKEEFKVDVEYDLVEDFGLRIKAAREKTNLTQDDLGKLINESHSVVHRIELGKYKPPVDIVRKLEKKLKVKLLEPHEEVDVTQKEGEHKDITLGDMIIIRKRSK